MAQLVFCFFAARKIESLNNETNSINGHERTGNNWVTVNILGTILGDTDFVNMDYLPDFWQGIFKVTKILTIESTVLPSY